MLATSSQLQKTVRELIPADSRIRLDLSNVNYIDSSGIGAMASVCLAASRQECELKVVNRPTADSASIRDHEALHGV